MEKLENYKDVVEDLEHVESILLESSLDLTTKEGLEIVGALEKTLKFMIKGIRDTNEEIKHYPPILCYMCLKSIKIEEQDLYISSGLTHKKICQSCYDKFNHN